MNYQEILNSPIVPNKITPLIKKMSQNNAPVLLYGEDGTGKGLIAKIIHYTGDWKYYGFYEVDCRFLNNYEFSEKIYSILQEINFGETPATIFLREISKLGLDSQFKLTKILGYGIFKKGKEEKEVKNLRFISSSTKNLREMVNQGRFLEELYNRLNIFSIYVPSLRERCNEISQIAKYILKIQSEKLKIKKVDISPKVLKLLQSYWWPENLRELEHVIIRSAVFSESEYLMEKDLFFETENHRNSFTSFLKKFEEHSSIGQMRHNSGEISDHSLSLFLLELVHRIKNPLVSIKTFTQLLREKFDDTEFREYFYKIVTEDILKIDSVLEGLLNYIKINTPIIKKNTIHSILEETLKKYEIQLENRKIKVFKKFEKDLPETIVHDEQLRYIFSSVIEYAISSIPSNGSIGLLTKVIEDYKKDDKIQSIFDGDGKLIEVLVVFTGYKKPTEKFEEILGISKVDQEEMVDLELRLIKEIVQRNHGMMRLEVNEKKPRTIILLRFPIERRKIIRYQWT